MPVLRREGSLGISLAGLIHTTELAIEAGITQEHTWQDLIEVFILKSTEGGKVSWAHVIQAKSHLFVGETTVFVSHVWMSRCLEQIAEVTTYARKFPDTVLWFDALCFASATPIPDDWTRWFRGIITDCTRVLVVLSLQESMISSRAWCLLEIVLAAEANLPVDFVIPRRECENLLRKITTDGTDHNWFQKLLEVDSERATAQKASEVENILAFFSDHVRGGFSGADLIYQSYVLKWLPTFTEVMMSMTSEHFVNSVENATKARKHIQTMAATFGITLPEKPMHAQ